MEPGSLKSRIVAEFAVVKDRGPGRRPIPWKGDLMTTPVAVVAPGPAAMPIKLGASHAFTIRGKRLDTITDIKITSFDHSVSWHVEIQPPRSATELTFRATPTRAKGFAAPAAATSGQLLIIPHGTQFTLDDNFSVDASAPIQCTITSGGTVSYPTGQQLSLIATFEGP